MKAVARHGGKRELIARGIAGSGALFLSSLLPTKDSLLVLNHHRIGNSADDEFDPGVFSATPEELDQQITALKRSFSLVTLEEAIQFANSNGKAASSRCRVLFTFDDGYLDNYTNAFPVLQSHGVQGVFFLCTSLVGSNYVPWWDRIAYITKTSKRPRFELRYPGPLSVDFRANGVEISLREILKLYKWPQNTDGERFVAELREACQGDEPPGAVRRFLDWGEAGAMLRGGMAIGSHTQTHPVLSQLDEDKQREELSAPRAVLKERLGIDPDALAYPVGARTSFSHVTERLAQDLGYRIAFSYHGGVNLPGVTRPYDVKRVAISSQSTTHFRVQTGVCRVTGKYWP